MRNLIMNIFRDRSGATAIEYGLIAALISVVVIVALTAVGSNLSKVYQSISTSLSTALPAAPAPAG